MEDVMAARPISFARELRSTMRQPNQRNGLAKAKKNGAGAPFLSGADWLLVNRQTTISEGCLITSRPALSNEFGGPLDFFQIWLGLWTAPGWQEESSLCSNGRSCHVFGLVCAVLKTGS
jgi:hypothetical protein